MVAHLSVNPANRFSNRLPCPICGGWDSLSRGNGARCHGFLSDEGGYAHCSREEYAGKLELSAGSDTYAHRLRGDCRCGVRHDPAPGTDYASPARDDRRGGLGELTRTYNYHDEADALLFQVLRYEQDEGKTFRQRSPDPAAPDGWRWQLGNVRRVLYRLPGLLSAARDGWVFLVEGEKDADALAAQGIVATCNAGGAGKWRPEYCEALRGRRVAMLPDNDKKGREHSEQAAHSLLGIAADVRIVSLPGLPDKGDVSDWLAAGGTPAQLIVLAEAAPVWTPEMNTKSARRPWYGMTLDTVEPEVIDWISRGRLARGKITILDGDPGLGKSTVLADWIARITTGQPFPGDAARPPAGAVILSAEDGLSDTIRPRLAAAGADLARVYALTGVPTDDGEAERLPALPDDLAAIEGAIRENGAALLTIDPLMAYLGSDVNSFRDQDVRRALAPLTALAERTGVAVVIVRHLNKAPGGSPLYRGGGSIGIIGAARCGLLLAADPDDPERRILASTKSNLALPPASLTFRLAPVPGTDVARVEWLGESAHTAGALLSPPANEEERGVLGEAREFLRNVLAGGRRPANDVTHEAEGLGIAKATLRRAKKALGVEAEREGFGGGGVWWWRLPPDAIGDHAGDGEANTNPVITYGEHGAECGFPPPEGTEWGAGLPIDAHPETMSAYGEGDHLRGDTVSEGKPEGNAADEDDWGAL